MFLSYKTCMMQNGGKGNDPMQSSESGLPKCVENLMVLQMRNIGLKLVYKHFADCLTRAKVDGP